MIEEDQFHVSMNNGMAQECIEKNQGKTSPDEMEVTLLTPECN